MAPDCNEVKISCGGIIAELAPTRRITLPAMPELRILTPCKSDRLLISLLNQPTICEPVCPQVKGMMLNLSR